MTPHYFRNSLISLELFVALAQCANLNYSGEAITTRYWDCCKPSCAWNGKADVNKPVSSCSIDDKPTSVEAGTACGAGGTAYTCLNQQPWQVNDTMSYGFAGAFIMPGLTNGGIEGSWCCACYQLDFTSEPLRGKSLIVQTTNTAYDITTNNRFSLAVGVSLYHWQGSQTDTISDTWRQHHVSKRMCTAIFRGSKCLWPRNQGRRQCTRL